MDVGPSVEKPVGGDTEMLGDEDEEITEDWPLINLDAPQSADTELVINERARQLLYELASSYVPFTGLPDFDRFIMGEITAPATSEPQTTEISTSEPPLRSVRDRPPTPFAMRPRRRRPTLPPLPTLQFIQSMVLTPFLEESHSRIFRREIYDYPDELKYGVTQMKNRRRRAEYIHFRKGGGSHRQKRIRHNIMEVFEVSKKKLSRCEFYAFKCTTWRGPQFVEFWEADFDSIDLEDLLAAIRDLRSGHVLRPPEWIQALETLKRYVRHAITLARVEDYQLALECESPTVNLIAPDLTCPNIDTVSLLVPQTLPEPGIIYPNREGERRYMRMSQLDHFSDGTLLRVRNVLADRLSREAFVTANRFDVERSKLQLTIDQINERLKYRLQIRRVEMACKVRPKTITTWDEYEELCRGQPDLHPSPPS
jgi:hypothetical protein